MSELPGTEAAIARAAELLAHDAEVRQFILDEGVLARLREQKLFSIEHIADACRAYAERPSFGDREIGPDGALGAYRTTSFGELWQRLQRVGSSEVLRVGQSVGICGFASTDFVVADLACLYAGAVAVPLPTTLSAEDLRHIVAETDMTTIFCSSDYLAVVAPALEDRSIRTLVVMDRGALVPYPGVAVHALAELERTTPRPFATPDHDRLVSILYTSGTTGAPKGAMYLDRTFAFRLAYTLPEPAVPVITMGCLPLAHVFGRFTAYRGLMRGGVSYFVAKSDMSTLLDDIRHVRPTVLTLVPRATGAVYQHYRTQLLARGDGAADEVMKEIRTTFLGDRLCLLITGSAATPPETAAFLKRCLAISLLEYYAFNEFGLVSVNGRIAEGVEYRLLDAPELGYTVRDRPFPRGELLVRSRNATPGYYKLPDLSARLRDAEGYLHSGDVVEERAPDELAWIDRRSNVIKLAQGEFVSLTQLEERFESGSALIAQVHLHGSSEHAYILAVIVPHAEGAPDEAGLRRALRSELDAAARAAQLARHEVPRDFIVERVPFSKENGLLTESGKPKRAALKAQYGERLDALYKTLEARQLVVANGDEDDGTVAARVHALVRSALGVESVEPSQSFVSLGGDSFGAVRLASLVQESFDMSLPVAVLLDAQTSLEELVRRIEAGGRDRWKELHDGSARIEASSLQLERFLPAKLLRPRAQPGSARSILLTGATGFLGRFVLLELLERGVAVTCVVRAANDRAAWLRLRETFPGEMAARFEAHVANLTVIAGDVMRARFGLAEERYATLAAQIDVVVHSAALVNHSFDFAQLFEPNVLGTVEVMRFALEGRAKSITFVSSSAVVAGLGRAITESETAAALWPSRAIEPNDTDRYAAGYATSKWASEVLLDQLATRCNVPRQIFRCGMILPHTRYLGQVNEGDTFTRILRGLVATDVAPQSFYADNLRERHYDGVPVDLVARALAACVLDGKPGIYHVTNAHWDDGVSLDSFVGWIRSAGHKLETIEPYAAWLAALKTRLEQLDLRTQRRSPLPILSRWAKPASGFIRMDDAQFRERLRTLLAIEEVPSLDERYLHHCLRSLAAT